MPAGAMLAQDVAQMLQGLPTHTFPHDIGRRGAVVFLMGQEGILSLFTNY